ncbi:MAG: hypothetical protein JWL57_2892, partial [Actinobacteria bacterium]|nr:hypothetical protein [Actinomycetota bacterium]
MAEEKLPRTQPGTTGPSLNLATPAAPSRRGGGLSTGQMALMTFAALVMGVLALLRVDSSALGDLGLVSVVGPVYFVAVALILVSFGFALCQRPLRRPLLAFQLIGLIALLDGLGPLVEPHASFATSWLHAGFAQYIAQHGATIPTLDARFSWPGFFALAAFLSKAAGLHSPVVFLRWAPLAFNLMYLPPLYAIFRAVTRNERAWWMGLGFFYLASWVGQDYFSPQAFNFFLFLVFLAVALRWFRPPMPDPGKGNRWERFMGVWMARLGGRGEERIGARSTPIQRGALIAILALIFLAMTVSHQLTPFLLLGGLIALLIFGRTTLRGFPLILAVTMVAWISLGAIAFWSGHLNLIVGDVGHLGANVSTSLTGRIQGSPGRLSVLGIRIALAGVIAAIALVGAIRRRQLGYGDWSLLLLAFAPFPVLAVQSYGGEALLRAYLFAMPFVALLAAMAFMPSTEPKKVAVPALCFCLVAAAFAPAWLVARYGNERFDRVSNADLAAVKYLYAHAQPAAPGHGKTTLISLFPQLPWRYQDINSFDYESVQNTTDPPNERGLVSLAVDQGLGDHPVYLIITRSQEAAGEALDSLPTGWAYSLGQKLVDNALAKVLYTNQDASVLEMIPPLAATTPPSGQTKPISPGPAL